MNHDDDPTPTPCEVPGRKRSTQQAIRLSEMARAAALKLAAKPGDAYARMARRALDLALLFEAWADFPPDDDERRRLTDELAHLSGEGISKTSRREE